MSFIYCRKEQRERHAPKYDGLLLLVGFTFTTCLMSAWHNQYCGNYFTENFGQYLKVVNCSLPLSIWVKKRLFVLDAPLAANIGIKGGNRAICHRWETSDANSCRKINMCIPFKHISSYDQKTPPCIINVLNKKGKYGFNAFLSLVFYRRKPAGLQNILTWKTVFWIS